ncbi:MAG: hypothetical protein QOF21_2669 [Actinomycetota bacterium]|jgi:very-short-patch-repair endonuclease
MRRLFTTAEFLATGGTVEQLRWGVKKGSWVRAAHGVYADGPEPVDALTAEIARVRARDSFAAGLLATTLHDLDGAEAAPKFKLRRGELIAGALIDADGVRCTNGLQTVIDAAALVDDLVWEQMLECALRPIKKRRPRLFKLDELVALLPTLERSRTPGVARMRRVLALRPPSAPPTESMLETLAVQMCRVTAGVPEPQRQVRVYDEYREFVARVDLAWPELGVFFELDGEGHKNQPKYDAARESAVVAATGWLGIRCTWTEVRFNPVATGRKLARVLDQARLRPTVAAK